MARRLQRGLVLVALVTSSLGCAGTLDPSLKGDGAPPGGDGGDGGGPNAVIGCARGAEILAACRACHSTLAAPGSGGAFDMERAGWDKALVGMTSPANGPESSLCRGKPLPFLEAGKQPARGLFLDKIVSATPACGVQMPKGLPKMSAADALCVQQWANGIVAGGNGS